MQRLHAILGNQAGLVVLATKSARSLVGNDQRNVLFQTLGLRVFDYVFRFGGKTDAKRRIRLRGNGREDVGRLYKIQIRYVVGRSFLDFLRSNLSDFPVGNGGDGDEYVLSVQLRLAGGEHIVGRLHINARHTKRCGQCGFTGN